MKNKKVIILGSGESILRLNEEEINYINNCEFVIALNKFAAFYKKAGIIPTHIYFHDLFGINILFYIIKILKNDDFKNVTIFTNSFVKNLLFKKKSSLLKLYIVDIFRYRLISLIKIIIKLGINCKIHKAILLRSFEFIHIPISFKIISLKLSKWNSEKYLWGKSLKDTLYHYRGSLTTVLNIVSIIAPNYEVYLVGNDFNGHRYFYEDELENLGIPWKDFTYEKVKKHKKHFSFQKLNGKSMSDNFPFVLKKLNESNNVLYCNNKESLLVTDCKVDFKNII